MKRADLASLSIFAIVASRQSFRAAARDLGLSPSAVSHAIAGLEATLGVRLLARTTRSVAATDVGETLLARIKPALAEIDDAITSLDALRSAPSGVLRLTVPRAAAAQLIVPRLGDFMRAFPDIVVEIVADDGFVDIVAGRFDAGLRFGESLARDMIAVRLGPPQRLIVVAAPNCLAGRDRPTHPRDLQAFSCIAQRFAAGGLFRWEFEKGGEALTLPVDGPLVLNDSRLIVDAAIAGAGVGFVFEDVVRDALADGRLVAILEDWCPSFAGFYLYYPTRRQMRPALRAFIDFFTRPSSLAQA